MDYIVYSRADGGVSLTASDATQLDFDKWQQSARPEWLPATRHVVTQDITPAEFKFHGSRNTVGPRGQPADNGLEWDGTRVVANMAKCRTVHMDRIRPARDRELVQADIALARAQDENDGPEQARLRTLRQALRDLPQSYQATLDAATTPEELDALWPPELPARP